MFQKMIATRCLSIVMILALGGSCEKQDKINCGFPDVLSICFHSFKFNIVHEPHLKIEKFEIQRRSGLQSFSRDFNNEKTDELCLNTDYSPTDPTYCVDFSNSLPIKKSLQENGSLIEVQIRDTFLLATISTFSEFDIVITTPNKTYKRHFKPEYKEKLFTRQDPCNGLTQENTCKSTELTLELD